MKQFKNYFTFKFKNRFILNKFKIVRSQSLPVNYYTILNTKVRAPIHGVPKTEVNLVYFG